MSKIGKAIFVSGGMHFAFTLTIGGTTYSFDEKSESSSVANVYTYSRTKQGNVDKWSLDVYASGTISFSKIKHLVDISVCGSGGGGGGSACGGSGITQWIHAGGSGGGGRVSRALHKMLSPNTSYTLTIGAGGAGGAGGPDSRGSRGNSGDGGNPTSFGSIVSATGGDGGEYGDAGSAGDAGELTQRVLVFEDDTRYVSGGSAYSYRGSGGGGGTGNYNPYGDPSNTHGNWGNAGLIVIRSTPKE